MTKLHLYLTTSELADICGVKDRTIRRWASKNEFGNRPCPSVKRSAIPEKYMTESIKKSRRCLYFYLPEVYVWVCWYAINSYKTWIKHRRSILRYVEEHDTDIENSDEFFKKCDDIKQTYGLYRVFSRRRGGSVS